MIWGALHARGSQAAEAQSWCGPSARAGLHVTLAGSAPYTDGGSGRSADGRPVTDLSRACVPRRYGRSAAGPFLAPLTDVGVAEALLGEALIMLNEVRSARAEVHAKPLHGERPQLG